jgi:hypothetical protein
VRPSAEDLRGRRSGAVDIEAVLRGQLGSVVAVQVSLSLARQVQSGASAGAPLQ